MREDFSNQIKQKDILHGLLEAPYKEGQKALDKALRRQWRMPSICWYPSAGNCFRDLWAWDQPLLNRIPPPRLFIHTDYQGPFDGIDRTDPHFGAMEITERHPLIIKSDVLYEVSSSYAARAGLAHLTPKVELLLVSIDPEILNRKDPPSLVPVLYFYFENINWFESMVFMKGLRFSHFFKRGEGLSGGDARASVFNLFSYFAAAGCRHLLVDPEVQIDYGLAKRLWGRYSDHVQKPFKLLRGSGLKSADLDDIGWKPPDSATGTMRYFRLLAVTNERALQSDLYQDSGPVPAWAEMALKRITAATPWDDKFGL